MLPFFVTISIGIYEFLNIFSYLTLLGIKLSLRIPSIPIKNNNDKTIIIFVSLTNDVVFVTYRIIYITRFKNNGCYKASSKRKKYEKKWCLCILSKGKRIPLRVKQGTNAEKRREKLIAELQKNFSDTINNGKPKNNKRKVESKQNVR